jgi:hypothetical protein
MQVPSCHAQEALKDGVTDQEAAEDVSHLHLRQEEGWHHQLGGN